MAIVNNPGSRLPTGQQQKTSEKTWKGTPIGGINQTTQVPQVKQKPQITAEPTGTTAPAPDPFAGKGYTEVYGMYKGSTDPRFRREAARALNRLRGAPQPAPTTTGAGTTGTTGMTGATGQADPFAGKSYSEVYGMYKGSTDPRFRREAARALNRLRSTAQGTAGAGAGAGPGQVAATAGTTQPTTVEESLATTERPVSPEEEDYLNLLPDEFWQQALAGIQQPGLEAPITKLPTQEELGQLLQQRYQQELADLTAGTEERQRREQLRREQDLINRGISPDSEAYRNEQRALAESRALEAAQARQQARSIAEQSTQNEYNRALAAAQEQRAAFETAQAARYKPLEALAPLVQTQAQLRQNRWANKFEAGVQKELTAMNLASDEKKYFAGLNQDDRQFWQTMLLERDKIAIDKQQSDRIFKESVRQFNEQQKITNKKILADIENDKNLTEVQRGTLKEMIRNNMQNNALEARKIAAINRGDTKTAAAIEAEQSAAIQGKIKGYYTVAERLFGSERAKEMVEQTFGKGVGGYDVGR